MLRCSPSARVALARSDVAPACVMMVKRTSGGVVRPVPTKGARKRDGSDIGKRDAILGSGTGPILGEEAGRVRVRRLFCLPTLPIADLSRFPPAPSLGNSVLFAFLTRKHSMASPESSTRIAGVNSRQRGCLQPHGSQRFDIPQFPGILNEFRSEKLKLAGRGDPASRRLSSAKYRRRGL